ncbi:hypothetical protein [Mesorhizobium sp. CAU 1741]|uniref:spike base protein, RCAP_Rcc01079 family n=1 Tax=Mesorhizobium sp. CAU 1741 TaxID=3140366 RepID=UPI00325AAC03
MQDRYETFSTGLESPVTHGFEITPDDVGELPELVRALYVGSAGAVALVLSSGASVTLSGVAGGTVLPLRAAKVLATGTTATGIVGLV